MIQIQEFREADIVYYSFYEHLDYYATHPYSCQCSYCRTVKEEDEKSKVKEVTVTQMTATAVTVKQNTPVFKQLFTESEPTTEQEDKYEPHEIKMEEDTDWGKWGNNEGPDWNLSTEQSKPEPKQIKRQKEQIFPEDSNAEVFKKCKKVVNEIHKLAPSHHLITKGIPQVKASFNGQLLRTRYYQYCTILEILDKAYPITENSISYSQAYVEIVMFLGKCEHKVPWRCAETQCYECDSKILELRNIWSQELQEFRGRNH
jgi:hypothetical protein